MKTLTQNKIDDLERRAAIRERQADEREERALPYYGGGSSSYIRSLDKAEEYRGEARQLRAEAARLRRQDP